MPCLPQKARKLLESGKAHVVRKCPFTIQLNDISPKFVQPHKLSVDPGSDTLGLAVVNPDTGEFVHQGEVTVRNDIREKMDRRRAYRRSRRSRKTRYRAPRFDNRGASAREDRLPPTLVSKTHSHRRAITDLMRLYPIDEVIIETTRFDTQRINDPGIQGREYQRGPQFGLHCRKAAVLDRDDHTCRHCDKKSTHENALRFEVHHIKPRSQGGTDTTGNLVTLCSDCHKKHHNGEIVLRFRPVASRTRHATHVDVIGSQLVTWLEAEGIPYRETSGAYTKAVREFLNLPKAHCLDAVAIALTPFLLHNPDLGPSDVSILNCCLYTRCHAKGMYQRSRGNPRKGQHQHHWQFFPNKSRRTHGFHSRDKVLFDGKTWFVKSARTRGSFSLMDIHGQVCPKVPNFRKLVRVQAATSRMMTWGSVGENVGIS